MWRALLTSILASLVACACAGASQPCPSPPASSTPVDAGSASREADHAKLAGPCRAPAANEDVPLLGGTPLVALCHGVYVDPNTPADARASIVRWYGEALAGAAGFFGPTSAEPPIVIVCTSDPCALRFSGPTRRSHAFMEPRPGVVINGIGPLTRGTILHELVHVAIIRRMGPRRRDLPTWFDEGVASFIGDNAPCEPGYVHPIDDLRRLREGYAWTSFTNLPGKMEGTYCQAREEIAAWVQRRGRAQLLEVVDGVTAGRPFDDLYGPLVTATGELDKGRKLVVDLAFDENADTNAVDKTGRHVATLMGGAQWAPGRRRSGVKLTGGGHVRIDGLVDYGLPDKPFSITLWVKPLTNTRVLVHTASNESGGQGWCMPLLGHDSAGHLTAQVPFGGDARSILSATGPVLVLNAWTHIAVTWNAADGLRLYAAGALVASAAPASPSERRRDAPAVPVRLFVGGDNAAACWTKSVEPGSWNGVVDDLRVFDYALAPDRVVADLRGGS